MNLPKLEFHLDWLDENAASLVNFSVTLGDKFIWPVEGDSTTDLEVFADDILSFLTENWHCILLEQTYPIYNATRPSLLRPMASVAWEQNEEVDAEAEDLRIEEFERSHNLASCFAGMMDVPAFWLMRHDRVILVETDKGHWRLPLKEVEASLCSLGDAIATRLSHDPKFSHLIDTWGRRSDKDPITLLATATSIPAMSAQKLVDANILRMPVDFADAANDDDELRIAARVTGALSLTQVSNILEKAKSVRPGRSGMLRQIKDAIAPALHVSPSLPYRKPYDTGIDVAVRAREFLNYSAAQRIDLEKALLDLHIPLTCASDLPNAFKGLAIWGKDHGPGIVVAVREQKDPWVSGFCRVTIAHELGHLLMDGDHAIGAVDVLRGRVPSHVEQRAKSFAGEFLLPTKTAIEAWQRAKHPRDHENINNLLARLQRTYGVTKSVAAWKLQHGLSALDVDLSDVLDEVAPER